MPLWMCDVLFSPTYKKLMFYPLIYASLSSEILSKIIIEKFIYTISRKVFGYLTVLIVTILIFATKIVYNLRNKKSETFFMSTL